MSKIQLVGVGKIHLCKIQVIWNCRIASNLFTLNDIQIFFTAQMVLPVELLHYIKLWKSGLKKKRKKEGLTQTWKAQLKVN